MIAVDYIPKYENMVAKGRDEHGVPYWDPLTADDLERCLDPNVTPEYLESLFPGPCFFGRLVGPSDAAAMTAALSVLRMTRELHGALRGGSALFEKPDGFAVRLAEQIEQVLRDYDAVTVTRGSGYPETPSDELAIPQCHIYSCSIAIPLVYANWLRPRVDSYQRLGAVFQAETTYYLLMSNMTRLEEVDGQIWLRIDVYGTQSLSSDFEPWLTYYESDLPDDTVLSGLELIAGLLHLADTLATLHLETALPVISHGHFLRTTADDSLTDLWLMSYDISSDADYSIGVCEVCNRLFIGTSKNKRGHKECMNRQRVARSRAKRFKALVETGMTDDEASRISGIAPDKARAILRLPTVQSKAVE